MKRSWPAILGVAAVAGYAVIWLWVLTFAHDTQRYIRSLPASEGVGPNWLLAPLPYLMIAVATIGSVLPLGAALALTVTTVGRWRRPETDESPSGATPPTAEYRLADLFAGQSSPAVAHDAAPATGDAPHTGQ
jgi:hypothetical protein